MSVLLETTTHGHTSVGQPAKTDIHPLCADIGCHPENLTGAMANTDGWLERVNWIQALRTSWWW